MSALRVIKDRLDNRIGLERHRQHTYLRLAFQRYDPGSKGVVHERSVQRILTGAGCAGIVDARLLVRCFGDGESMDYPRFLKCFSHVSNSEKHFPTDPASLTLS